VEVTDAMGKPVDVGSVWLELRLDMPGMPMQATALLERGQSSGAFDGSVPPTGQGERHATVGYENPKSKSAPGAATKQTVKEKRL
jgi:hypothetical protein